MRNFDDLKHKQLEFWKVFDISHDLRRSIKIILKEN